MSARRKDITLRNPDGDASPRQVGLIQDMIDERMRLIKDMTVAEADILALCYEILKSHDAGDRMTMYQASEVIDTLSTRIPKRRMAWTPKVGIPPF